MNSVNEGDPKQRSGHCAATAVLIAVFLPFCWFAMQTVHELGHVAGGILAGGELRRVVLHPAEISRTDFAENPRPLVTVWSGPVIGIALPLAIWLLSVRLKSGEAFLARFFVGFCLIANGCYVGIGWTIRAGDAGTMLRHGSPVWLLVLFGLSCVPAGLACWHGQAAWFGIGRGRKHVAWRTAVISASLLTGTLVFNLAMTWWL